MDPLEGLTHNFVTALVNFVGSAIYNDKAEHQDSIGTLYEEKALHEASLALIKGIVAVIQPPTREA